MPRISGSSTFEGVLVDWSLDQPVSVPALPVQLLSKEQVATELQRRQRRRAMDAAYEAELILRMAELTSDEHDPPTCTPGARTPGWATADDRPGVSEFFPESWRWSSTAVAARPPTCTPGRARGGTTCLPPTAT